MAGKVKVVKFDLSLARDDATKVCDSSGNSPYSVTVLSGAAYEGPKVAVVWSRNSRAVLYDAEGNRVYGTSTKPKLYLKGRQVLYAGVYKLVDPIYRKENTFHVSDASQEDLNRISSSANFRGWISGPTAVV